MIFRWKVVFKEDYGSVKAGMAFVLYTTGHFPTENCIKEWLEVEERVLAQLLTAPMEGKYEVYHLRWSDLDNTAGLIEKD